MIQVAWTVHKIICDEPSETMKTLLVLVGSHRRRIFYILKTFWSSRGAATEKGSKHNETQTEEDLPLFGERINNI